MKTESKLILFSFLVWCFVANAQLVPAQTPDFSNMTLNFKDVTSTNLNSTVSEMNNNEKSIDFGDYDKDGDLDVVLSSALSDFGQRRNKLYRNDNGVLNEVSGTDIIPEFASSDTSREAMFRDFDKDGWLDILIVNDANSGAGTITSPGRTRLYRNVDGLYFVNETLRLGNPSGAASSGVAADFNGNGFLDLAFSNHPNGNQDSITFNNINGVGAGNFEEITNTNMPQDNEYGVHIDAADMNGDGQIDLLMANHTSDTSLIYYNNNNGLGSGQGDFKYGGSSASSEFPSSGGGIREKTLVPADFNNDGKIDLYVSNDGSFGAQYSDAIYVNIGNDKNNKAVFATQPLSSELDDLTIRSKAHDLDGDGRIDLVIVAENRRPYIFRNTSENGDVSFLEWTPAAINNAQQGWGVATANVVGDSSPDLFFGAMNDDYLFESADSQTFTVEELQGVLPSIHNSDPIQIVGRISTDGTAVLVSSGIPAGASVSVLLRSAGDTSLDVSDGSHTVTSSRLGHGTDEAIDFDHSGGELTITVQMDAIAFDANGDELVNLLDVAAFVDCLNGVSEDCDPFDTNDDGLVTLLDVSEFIDVLSSGSQNETFFLEILSRSD